jgi:hypothetical protein
MHMLDLDKLLPAMTQAPKNFYCSAYAFERRPTRTPQFAARFHIHHPAWQAAVCVQASKRSLDAHPSGLRLRSCESSAASLNGASTRVMRQGRRFWLPVRRSIIFRSISSVSFCPESPKCGSTSRAALRSCARRMASKTRRTKPWHRATPQADQLARPSRTIPLMHRPFEWAAIFSEPDSELYMAHVSFGSVSRLSMTHIIASLAKPSAMTANAS